MCHKLLFDDDDAKTKKRNHHLLSREGYPHRWYYIVLIYLYSISEKKYRCIIYMYVRMDFLV